VHVFVFINLTNLYTTLVQDVNLPTDGENDGQFIGSSYIHTIDNKNRCTITIDPIID
jgi:hypothetical protein